MTSQLNITSLITLLLIVLLDVIAVCGLKRTFPKFYSLHRRLIRNAFMIQAIVSVIIMIGGFLFQHRVRDYRLLIMYSYFFGVVTALYIPKAIYAAFLFVDCILSTVSKWDRRLFDRFPRGSRRIIAKCGLCASLFFVCLFLLGILIGRNYYTVEQVEINFADLPRAFNGYKIVHISDIHAGSFAGSVKRFQKAVDLINGQYPDLIIFTGDMVNNFADEITSLIPVFSQINAPERKFAVLGNHDYGGYFKWDTPADSVANHEALENAIEQMGFKLLNNQSVIINHYNTDRIALVGVENWGTEQRYPKRADLEKATESVQDIPFKILLTHNPLFWSEYVEGKSDITLTLSGHTHGMQMGIKLGKNRYSPASLLRNPHWAGLYQTGRQFLYVNRGLGVIGFPGRVGMLPEISVITLWKEISPEQP
jgi:predicted MPP superfamily phosphohydrolase